MFKLKLIRFLVLAFTLALVSPVFAAVSNFDLLNEDTDTTFEHTEGRIWIDPRLMQADGGTWTYTAGTNLWFMRWTTEDATRKVVVPISIPGQTTSGKGYKITAIRIFYDFSATGAIGITPLIYELTMPAHGAQMTGASKAFTYDTSHDTYLERITADEHTMVLTITSASWSSTGVNYQLEFSVNGDGASQFDFYGIEVDFTYNML